MKRLSWPGVIVVAGSTILSWINVSPIISPTGQTREAIGPDRAASTMPTDASIAAMRLHDWGPRPPAPGRLERDIFAFKRRAAAPAPLPPPSRGLLEAGGEGHQPPLGMFKLIGFAEDAGPDGVIRTAIISGQGQLYLVKEGETVAWIYRVGTMWPDSVELLDSTGGPIVRLALK